MCNLDQDLPEIYTSHSPMFMFVGDQGKSVNPTDSEILSLLSNSEKCCSMENGLPQKQQDQSPDLPLTTTEVTPVVLIYQVRELDKIFLKWKRPLAPKCYQTAIPAVVSPHRPPIPCVVTHPRRHGDTVRFVTIGSSALRPFLSRHRLTRITISEEAKSCISESTKSFFGFFVPSSSWQGHYSDRQLGRASCQNFRYPF